MPRTKPPKQRRADLQAAGQALFVEKGIAATTLDDITTRAGVSKGLFYLYFQSKDHLVASLQEGFASQFATRIRAAAAAEEDWGAKLDAAVDAAFACYRELSDLHEVLFRPGAHGDEEPSHAQLALVLSELLAEGTAAGAYAVEDPVTTAALLYVTTHAFDPTFHGRTPPSDDRLLVAARQLFRRAAGILQ